MAEDQSGPTASPDTPIKRAIRTAFDNPTVENIEAVAMAAAADCIRLRFFERVLRATKCVLRATKFDYCSDIWWREWNEPGSELRFYANCSDIFVWGCSDLEEITPRNIDVLEQSIQDCRDAADDHHWGVLLFVARVRQMRPQGAVLKQITNPQVLALFDAAGPKREIDLGNPYAHPSDGGQYEYTSPDTCLNG